MNNPQTLRSCLIIFLLLLFTACGGGGGGGGDNNGSAFTVSYDGNGNSSGSAPLDSTKYQQGENVTVLGNTGNLAKNGFAFNGWNTQANGAGTTYTQGQTFALGAADVTLYAKWTAGTTYTVTYNGNGNTGGTVPVDSTAYTQGQIVTVPGNTGSLAKAGYVFAGWNTQANGLGMTYTQGLSFMMGAANVTLYAKWSAGTTYTVTYNGNGNTGGSVPADGSNYSPGQTVAVLGNTGGLTRTGYTFSGWNTQANGSGTSYAAAQTFTMGSANVVLYAKWSTTLCTPSQTRCVAGNISDIQSCNTQGTAWVQSTCPNWQLCSLNACRTICDITSAPAYPTICMVPNHDGVNNGEWLTWSDNTLSVSTYATGRSHTNSGGYAPVYSSGQTWPYSWSISSADSVGISFKLNQYGGSYKHPRLGFKARRSNIVNDGYSNRYLVGVFDSVPNMFASCVWGPVPLSWAGSYCDVGGTYYTQFDYSGGYNSMLLSITGDGFGHAIDLLDVNYLYLSIRP